MNISMPFLEACEVLRLKKKKSFKNVLRTAMSITTIKQNK